MVLPNESYCARVTFSQNTIPRTQFRFKNSNLTTASAVELGAFSTTESPPLLPEQKEVVE